MNYIYRELLLDIESYLISNSPKGVILSGIVGCGKTTMVQCLLEKLSSKFQIFTFTGDDIQFRKSVAEDSFFLLQYVQSQTQKKSLIFVDEVQKTEEVFDAIKVAFDSGQCSFIVSGSNPAFLSSVAKKRLQRRAYHFHMLPLGLSEILAAKKIITETQQLWFKKNFWEVKQFSDFEKIKELSLVPEILSLSKTFFKYGGLPLSYLEPTSEKKLMEIRLTVERGFELFKTSMDAASEKIKIELAHLQSKEFTYKNILERTRINKRDVVNFTIDELINHGYLVKKKPILLKEGKTSYLSTYSYIDPGVCSYLLGTVPKEQELGFALEGYIHSRLDYFIKNSPYKSEMGYYKEHTIDINNKIKFSNKGEIDFVIIRGKQIIPLEIKLTNNLGQIETKALENFIQERKLSLGYVIYGGVPFVDKKRKLVFWPYWLI